MLTLVAFLSGEHDTKDLSKIMYDFINEVVLCPNCGLPEILIVPEQKTVMGTCRACGAHSELKITDEKFKRYVINHPPTQSKGAFGGNKAGAKYLIFSTSTYKLQGKIQVKQKIETKIKKEKTMILKKMKMEKKKKHLKKKRNLHLKRNQRNLPRNRMEVKKKKRMMLFGSLILLKKLQEKEEKRCSLNLS